MAQVGANFTVAVPSVPVGSLQAYAGASAPNGWLLCDGSAVSRSLYSELFSVLGVTYGSGDGSTTFNVPDLRGRVPMGAGTGAQNGGSGTGVISGGTALTARTRGGFGGDERIATHSHTATDSGHNHAYLRVNGNQQMYLANAAAGGGVYGLSSGVGSILDVPNGNANITVANNANGGSGGNMPPFVVTQYIIKAISDIPRGGITASSTPPIVTVLPANPQFGDQVIYVADSTNGAYWQLQYDGSGTYPWKFIGGGSLYASADGTYSSPITSSTTTYVNSNLTGSPTITAPLAGDYHVTASCSARTSNTSPAPGIFISFNGSTPSSWDGADALSGNYGATSYPLSANKKGTLTSANQSIALVYCNANIGGSFQLYSIRINATPIRVKAA